MVKYIAVNRKRHMEKNYTRKEELIEQLKELLEDEDSALAFSKAKVLSKKWGKVREEEESLYDKEMQDQFNMYMDQLAEKAGDIALNTEERKLSIIERAKEAASGENFKKANEAMKDLMEEWKHSGRINKERDDELWEQFNAIRNDFFERRNEYYHKLKEGFSNNKHLKLDIIERAKELVNIENMKEASTLANQLMDEWKKVGSAGHKDDESLWEKFLAERKAFNERRDEYFANMKEVYAQRVEEKKALIAEAKMYLARSTFTEDEVEAVKDLRARWKEIGNAGKENENKLWEEFNSTINSYYDHKKFYEE